MTAATGDPSPWPAADIRISTLPYELLARVIFHARARVIIARCASGRISTLPYELLARVIFHARARVIIARCASGESQPSVALLS